MGSPAHLLAAVGRINGAKQPVRFARRLFELSGVDEPRLALLGLTFKPDTDDLRDAPSLAVTRELVALGARTVAYDPMPSARQRAAEAVPGLEVVETLAEALASADGIGLITEWDVFRRIDWKAARSSPTRGSSLTAGMRSTKRQSRRPVSSTRASAGSASPTSVGARSPSTQTPSLSFSR